MKIFITKLPNFYLIIKKRAQMQEISFEKSTIYYLPSDHNRSVLYASLLSQEIQSRAYISLPSKPISSLPSESSPSPDIYLSVNKASSLLSAIHCNESYAIYIKNNSLVLESSSERGLLFAVGRLIRQLNIAFNQEYEVPLQRIIKLPSNTYIISSPKYPAWRGHQIAYRPKTNTYDAFTLKQMQQEILDCVLWGANVIEIIPPELDDYQQSPHFQASWLDIIRGVSDYCDQLDIMTSIWYPAYFQDYSEGENMNKALIHWKMIFGALKRLDKLFVPGGDPGGRDPKLLFEIIEKQADFMRKNYFPSAEVWVSSQFGLAISSDLGLKPWNPKEYENRFYESLHLPNTSNWLTGVVYGPWTADPIEDFRKNIPKQFPLRNYPDLCHSVKCEFPVQNWDISYALTNSRECINPRPLAHARIISDQAPLTIGCGCYSEGVNDDVNKVIWSSLHWGVDIKGTLMDENTLLDDILLQYGKVYIKQDLAGLIRELIYALEKNWIEDPITSSSVERTYYICQEIDAKISCRDYRNWRLQSLLFRGYYDVFLAIRRKEEANLETEILDFIENKLKNQSINKTIEEAAKIYQYKAYNNTGVFSCFSKNQWPGKEYIGKDKQKTLGFPNIMVLISRLNLLAGALYQGIGLQLSAIWHGGLHTERGAFFDLAWISLSNLNYIDKRLTEISKLQLDYEKINEINDLLDTIRHKSSIYYYSFGDNSLENMKNEPSLYMKDKQITPFSKIRCLGEDPTYFYTPLLDYADPNSTIILSMISNGVVKRSWLSWMTSIWPRLPYIELDIPVDKIKGYMNRKALILDITYVGRDLWVEGGDWIDFNRTVEPTRLLINGEEIHGFYVMEDKTRTHSFDIKENVIKEGRLRMRFEVKMPENITIRTPILPIADINIREFN